MIRLITRLPHSHVAVMALAFAASSAALHAQTDVPAAPAAPQQQPGTTEGPAFPKPDPADFTATTPTKEQVMGFLQASWGYDPNRVFQVERIAKTSVEGISNVIVAVGEKGNKQVQALQFFALPDGKHIIAQGEILPFGANPYAENKALLEKRATGPSHGAADKKLLIVEFADFQCPHCKDAQPNMDKLAQDFPNAHIVFENYPIVKLHPQAMLAAEYGQCVAKLGGNDAFFKYANAAFDGQAGLATADGAQLTLNSAVTASGQDPTKVAACAKDPATETAIKEQIQLAQDLSVNQTPTLAIDGRIIPLGGLDYETLKRIVSYHANGK